MFPCRRAAQSAFQPHARPPLPQPHPPKRSPFRSFSQQYSRRGPQYRYTRYAQTKNLLQRWAASPYFYHQVGGIGLVGGGFYTYNLETVPMSGRRRFNFIGPEMEESIGKGQYAQVLQEYKGRILPPHARQVRKVRQVLDSGLQDLNWEVFVIDSDEQNAFVIPGGKVFVFTGILPLCQDDDGIAAVLGHEIAHNFAHHTAEKLSRYNILTLVAVAVAFSLGIGDSIVRAAVQLAFELPNGRAQESEADYIGLMMMSQSCYDPEGAISFWGRMVKSEKGAPPEFMSTHPSSSHRVARLTEWLPEAARKRDQSACGGILDYSKFHPYRPRLCQCAETNGDQLKNSEKPSRSHVGKGDRIADQHFGCMNSTTPAYKRFSFAIISAEPLLGDDSTSQQSGQHEDQGYASMQMSIPPIMPCIMSG
ncbi:mitochondrial metalloendopeptidase oma1 [Venturia nashicola]|uniref:Mitochondrial metalloendopeptidase oma1 n=1 Tax=Venturia nashicola TaxID=86259 RepID=A0A4Z1P2V5_9PEZI|nr:mitochondrial metalloendopeptidase oma1 [Venturia nashicola]